MDYSKLKVAELKDLLTARSLPVYGKKEDLVARLTENDGKQKVVADDLGDLAPPEEDYDWDAPTTKTPAKTEAKPAPPPATTTSSKPATATAHVATAAAAPKRPLETPKTSADTTAKSPPTTETSDADAALAIELEKRKRRAERFGIPLVDSAKAIERSKRFGGTTPPTEETKKEARGKKFGNQVWSNDAKKSTPATTKKILDDPTEAEKAKKRAERFGGGNEAKKVKT